VSCARDGESQGIMFSVLREVEKEVVLLDQTSESSKGNEILEQTPSDASGMVSECTPHASIDSLTSPSVTRGPRVLKVIRKVEVQVLCNQHNPVSICRKLRRECSDETPSS
jgi:hypothetical protein